MRIIDAVTETLVAAGEPLHYREITRRIQAAGLVEFSAGNPSVSVASALSAATREAGSEIVRLSAGRYGIRRPGDARTTHAMCGRRPEAAGEYSGPAAVCEEASTEFAPQLSPSIRALLRAEGAADPDIVGVAQIAERVVLEDLGEPYTPENEATYLEIAETVRRAYRAQSGRLDFIATIESETEALRFVVEELADDVARAWLEARYPLPFALLSDTIDDPYVAASLVRSAMMATPRPAEGVGPEALGKAMRAVATQHRIVHENAWFDVTVRVRLRGTEASIFRRLSLAGLEPEQVIADALHARAAEIDLFGERRAAEYEAEIALLMEDSDIASARRRGEVRARALHEVGHAGVH